MSSHKIPLLYSPEHKHHAPPVELWNGKLVAYPEIPRRIEKIKDHLQAAGLTTLRENEEVMPREAITEVHDPGMVDYLERMSTGLDDFLSDPDNFYATDHVMEEQQYFFPAVFPIRPSMTRIRESAGGHHGFDTYRDDPAAFFNVDLEGYYRIGRGVAAMELPLLLVQEGGYRVEALGELAAAFVRGVLGL